VQDESGGSANTPADRYRLLNALYFLERWDEAYAIAEALIQGDPTQLSHLALKGILAARLGRKEEAKRTSERIAALEIPYDRGETTFIRACIASLLGERDHAFRLLEEAHRQGWGFDVTLHTDMDLEPLRGYPPFEDFLRPKG